MVKCNSSGLRRARAGAGKRPQGGIKPVTMKLRQQGRGEGKEGHNCESFIAWGILPVQLLTAYGFTTSYGIRPPILCHRMALRSPWVMHLRCSHTLVPQSLDHLKGHTSHVCRAGESQYSTGTCSQQSTKSWQSLQILEISNFPHNR